MSTNRIYQASYNDRRVSMLDHLERSPAGTRPRIGNPWKASRGTNPRDLPCSVRK